MRTRIYDLLQKLFVVFIGITFALGFALLVVQLFALVALNGALAAQVYGIIKNPMCICASFAAVCGALRPYVKGKS